MNCENVSETEKSAGESILEILQQRFQDIAEDLPRLHSGIKEGDEIAQHFYFRLGIALENAAAGVLLVRMNLTVPLHTIARSLFESLISTYWASLDNTNANTIMQSGKCEMLRLMRNNLNNGRAVIQNTATNTIESDLILKHPIMQEAKRPPKFDKMAEAAGLKNIYDQFYGIMSIYAHGHATEFIAKDLCVNAEAQAQRKKGNNAILLFIFGCLKSIQLISTNYIRENRKTELEELEKILGVKLSS